MIWKLELIGTEDRTLIHGIQLEIEDNDGQLRRHYSTSAMFTSKMVMGTAPRDVGYLTLGSPF